MTARRLPTRRSLADAATPAMALHTVLMVAVGVYPPLLVAAAVVAVGAGRRWWLRHTGLPRSVHRLTTAWGIHDRAGFLTRRLPAPMNQPRPRLRVTAGPRGPEVAIREPAGFGGRSETADEAWQRFAAALEAGDDREVTVRADMRRSMLHRRRWVTVASADPLPDQLTRPADTWRGHVMRVPLGRERDGAGQLAELVYDLTEGHMAIAGTTGSGKTGLLAHLLAHFLDVAIPDGQRAPTVEILTMKRASFPPRLANHPRVAAMPSENDDDDQADAIYARLVAARTAINGRDADACANETPPTLVADGLGRHVLVFDELGEALRIVGNRRRPRPCPPDFIGREEFVSALTSILAKGREFGYHVIAANQDFYADQFGRTSRVRSLFAAATSGRCKVEVAKTLELPAAATLPVINGKVLAGRMVASRDGHLPVRYQAYHRTYLDLRTLVPDPQPSTTR